MVFTDFLQLYKWEAADLVSLEQINENTQRLDDAVGALRFLAAGTYTGDGRCGAGAENELRAQQTPRLLLLLGAAGIAFLAPLAGVGLVQAAGGVTQLTARYDAGRGAVCWYGATAQAQMNEAGENYGYVALG